MKSHFEKTLRLGILGGGQLARMLALQAHRMGIEPWVLCEKNTDPAAQVTRFWIEGSPHNPTDLSNFCSQVSFVTFESEFLDADVLASLNEQIFPSPLLMGILQDRWSQKELLQKYKIPTAEYVVVENAEDLQQAWTHFPKGFVLKKRRGGYDGYGTYMVRTAKDLGPLLELLPKETSGFIAEAFIPFKRELAIILGRDQNKHSFTLPLVETKQTNAKCDWVQGPIKHTKASALIVRLQKMLQKENYVGVIGFELFDTGKEILVNELAPRVHNSAHYSLDALSEDQFSLHVKAVCGISCESPKLLAPGFAMANLLGTKNSPADWKSDFTAKLHWYGKTENRPGRKMGHLTTTGATAKKALTQALKDRKKFSL